MIKTSNEVKTIQTEYDGIEILIAYTKKTDIQDSYRLESDAPLLNDSDEEIELKSVEIVIKNRSVEFLRQLTQNQIDYLKKII